MYDDAMYDQYIAGLVHETSMEIVTLQQCIYLFVEGPTEEEAFPELLAKCDLDLDKLGVVIANYNGIGNLITCLRLLDKTLSHNRPVVVTLDNDESGKGFFDKFAKFAASRLVPEQIRVVPLPSIVTPIKYSDGHCGGSFEELFMVDHFLDQTFSTNFLPKDVVSAKKEFLKDFRQDKSWFAQIKKFCAQRGHVDLNDIKVALGVRLAETCSEIPPDIRKLTEIIKEVRNKCPICHPDVAAIESIRKRNSQQNEQK